METNTGTERDAGPGSKETENKHQEKQLTRVINLPIVQMIPVNRM